MLAIIAAGTLGTAYVLRAGMNEKIKALEAINRNLSKIEEKLEALKSDK